MESDKERIERLEEAYRKLWAEHEDLKHRIKENYQEFKALRDGHGYTPKAPVATPQPQTIPVSSASTSATESTPTPVTPKPAALPKKNTEWEKFIGEQLLSKIGLLVLLVGLVIGTKYAIDHNWLSIGLRIGGTYLIALILGFFAYRFREKYRTFSAVLASGGVSISYFITYAAFSWYHVIPFGVSFGGLLICAALAVYLAMYYNQVIIAHFGLIAAYVLPPLISTSDKHLSYYLAYMLVINAGMLAISLLKNWKSIRVPILIWSNLVFVFWFFGNYHEQGDWLVATVYALLYLMLFHVSAILSPIRRGEQLPTASFGEIIPVSLVSFGILRYIFYAAENSLTANVAFTALLLAYFGVAAFLGSQRKDTVLRDVNVLTCLGILVITIFLDAGIEYQPVFGMTIFGTLFIAQLRYRLVQFDTPVLLGFSVFTLQFIILRILPELWDGEQSLFVPGMILSGIFLALCAYNYRIKEQTFSTQEVLPYLTFGVVFAVISAKIMETYLLSVYNIEAKFENAQGIFHNLSFYAALSLIGATFFVLFFAFMAVKRFGLKTEVKPTLASLFTIAAGVGLLYFSLLSWFAMYLFPTYDEYFPSYVLGRYGAFFAIIGVFYFLLNQEDKGKNRIVSFSLAILWILSLELSQWSILSGFGAGYKIVLTLLWVAFSVGMIYRGLLKNSALLRITAMIILGVSMVKLFFFDLTRLSTITKVVVFMLVGALLLVGAYFYQRLAKAEREAPTEE